MTKRKGFKLLAIESLLFDQNKRHLNMDKEQKKERGSPQQVALGSKVSGIERFVRKKI